MNAMVPANMALMMSSLEIATLVDSRHDSVKRTIERLAESRVIVQPPTVDEQIPDALGRMRTTQVYQVNKRDSFVVVAQLSPEFTARLVDRWQELESHVAKPQHSLPQSLPEALRLAADLAEQKALAEQQRDQAIATKALIGSRREATAMATASAAKREAQRLEIELDKSKEYASVKCLEKKLNQKFDWRLLKRTALDMGIPILEAFDQNFGKVNAYHADVWRKAYAIDINAPIAQAEATCQ